MEEARGKSGKKFPNLDIKAKTNVPSAFSLRRIQFTPVTSEKQHVMTCDLGCAKKSTTNEVKGEWELKRKG